MATILEFRQGPRNSAARRSGSQAAAEIVFFPGVRYERWDEAPPARKEKKRVRRHDRIELND